MAVAADVHVEYEVLESTEPSDEEVEGEPLGEADLGECEWLLRTGELASCRCGREGLESRGRIVLVLSVGEARDNVLDSNEQGASHDGQRPLEEDPCNH